LRKQRINLFNRQRKFSLDSGRIIAFLESLADRLSLEREFSVVLLSDSGIRRYNRQFADKNTATDVLSFPTEEDPAFPDNYLGDILISTEAADRLSLHGLLHLIGYDHENDQGEMAAKELSIRDELGLGH
jgi:probable rRNA maturation factor